MPLAPKPQSLNHRTMIQRTAQPPQPYSAYKPNTLSPTRPKVLRLPPWPCAFAGDSRDAAADYPVIQKAKPRSQLFIVAVGDELNVRLPQ